MKVSTPSGHLDVDMKWLQISTQTWATDAPDTSPIKRPSRGRLRDIYYGCPLQATTKTRLAR